MIPAKHNAGCCSSHVQTGLDCGATNGPSGTWLGKLEQPPRSLITSQPRTPNPQPRGTKCAGSDLPTQATTCQFRREALEGFWEAWQFPSRKPKGMVHIASKVHLISTRSSKYQSLGDLAYKKNPSRAAFQPIPF